MKIGYVKNSYLKIILLKELELFPNSSCEGLRETYGQSGIV